jgi:hypothetical protein
MNSELSTAILLDPLQCEIEETILLLKQVSEAEEGAFRRLCYLARHWRTDAETFSTRLIRAGLPPSRASEIKVVLLAEDVRDAFIKITADGKAQMSWKVALQAARLQRSGLNPEVKAASQLTAFMHRRGILRVETAAGAFTLEPRRFVLKREISRSKIPT